MAIDLNVPQQVFTIFYAISWGTAANAQPRWKAFAVGVLGQDRPSRWRFILSFLLLNLLPFLFFAISLKSLAPSPWCSVTSWGFRTLWLVFVSMVLALAPFGFYRMWTAAVQSHPMRYYGAGPYKDKGDEKRPEIL